jgi:flagellar biosynthesis/type III secretory pathway M-ring protein FliF/YscJ
MEAGMEQLKRVLATIQKNLGKLGVTHRLFILSLGVILLMTLFLVSQYAGSPKMVELLPGASGESQQKALAFLAERGYPHTNTDGKVMVPVEKQLTILAALGEAGRLPEDAALTFRNVVERQNWMNPKSLNDQIFNTALENTLAQCLKSFKGIEAATVVIDAPPAAGIGGGVRKPTASVIVFTRGGASLEAGTVNAIAATVASAKAGLDPKSVNISDGTSGRHYTARSEDDFAASSYMEHVAKYEHYIEDKLAAHLHYIRGVSIAVNAQVDVRRTESRSRTVKPKGQGSEVLPKRESTTAQTSEAAGDGGAPGLQSNVRMSIDQAAGGKNKDNTEQSDTEYDSSFGMVEEATVDPRGMATRINAAIGVPRDYVVQLWEQANPQGANAGGGAAGAKAGPTDADLKPIFEAEKTRLEAAVGPLIQTDARTGTDGAPVQAGSVVVSMIPVPVGALDASGAPTGVGGASTGGMGSLGTLAISGWVKTAALGALAAVSLAMMMLMVRKASKPVAMPSAEELVGIPPALATASDLIGEAEEGDTAMVGIEVDDQTLKTQKMLEEVGDMVKTRPSDAAAILQRWVQTEV